MIGALRYWVFAANIDGFRCDYADGPTREFWVEALANLKSIKSHKLLMLAEGDRKKYFFQVGFPLNYDFPFIQVMRHSILEHGKSVQLLDSLNNVEYQGAPADARLVRYTSNHDINSSEGPPQGDVWRRARRDGRVCGGRLHEGGAHDLQWPGSGLRQARNLHGPAPAGGLDAQAGRDPRVQAAHRPAQCQPGVALRRAGLVQQRRCVRLHQNPRRRAGTGTGEPAQCPPCPTRCRPPWPAPAGTMPSAARPPAMKEKLTLRPFEYVVLRNQPGTK
ncbi:MAG: hypothetical protein WKG07_05615 [Hymenobacter sp.]